MPARSFELKHFFDVATSTLTYVIWDRESREAAIIDPVWDFDPASGVLSEESFQTLIGFIREARLKPLFILETHAHADHVSSSQLLKREFPEAVLAIGERIQEVQSIFKKIFGFGSWFSTDGRQFDRLLKEGEVVRAGTLSFQVLSTSGHTPACCTYVFGDFAFTGDALFMPDSGTGRCDFPGGSAQALYQSITEKIYKLPETTRLLTGHDYQPNGRPLQFESTVKLQKETNIHLKASTTLKDYVEFRTKRDAGLSAPRLLLPSIQINMNAGNLPPAEESGDRFLKLPLRLKSKAKA